MISKKDFFWVWADSSKRDILNQFYYDHIEMLEAYNIINKAIEYIKDHYNLATKEEGVAFFILRDNLLEILGDREIEEIPQFKGTLEALDNLTLGGKENE